MVSQMSNQNAPLEYTIAITTSRLDCCRNLVESTVYDETAMWWFVDTEFDGFLSRVLNERPSREVRLRSLVMYEVYRRLVPFLRALQTILIRSILFLYKKTGARRTESTLRKIMFTAQNIEWRPVRDNDTGQIRMSDAFFDSTMKNLARECECMGVYPLWTSYRGVAISRLIRNLKILIEKWTNWYVPHIPFELYWSPATTRTEREAHAYFLRKWRQLGNDRTFKKICLQKGATIGRRIENQVEYYFRVTFPSVASYIDIAERMIEKEKPRLVMIQNENGLFERCLVVACRRLGVPTLAVQHGDIDPYRSGYMCMRDQMSADVSERSRSFPIPNMTAVFGPYYRDLLTRLCGYPENAVVVTGQPRCDRLFSAKKIYSRESFLERHGIVSSNKVILWTTQCHVLGVEENSRNLKAVISAIREMKDTTLIIKEHPGERGRYRTMIERYLHEQNVDAILLSGNADTYELLFTCNLLVTKYSTTAMEAVAMGRPVIILDLNSKVASAAIDYVEEGVALGVHEENALRPAIERLVSGDTELSSSRKRFVKKYLYRIDGKASERLIGLVCQMIGINQGARED